MRPGFDRIGSVFDRLCPFCVRFGSVLAPFLLVFGYLWARVGSELGPFWVRVGAVGAVWK